MPSNKELQNALSEAAKVLGVDTPDTTDMKNAEMAETLKEANAEIEDRKAEKEKVEREELEEAAKDDSAAAALLAKKEAEEKEPEPEELPPFTVAKGKALTTIKRGIRADGQEITEDDLAGGKKALTAFVKSGHVDKN